VGGSMCGRVHSRQTARRIFCRADCRRSLQLVKVLSRSNLLARHTRRWVSSFHRAMNGDALRARSSSALCASRCCFFDGCRGQSTVSTGCVSGGCVSRVARSRPCRCRLPALAEPGVSGEMVMEPSRRHSSRTPSLRERRAAWRRSCHWRALRVPRDPRF